MKSDKRFTIVLLFIFVIFNLFFFPCTALGPSMYPTIKPEHIYIASRNVSDIQRGDIVVFKHDGHRLIKRVIALPGESVQFIDKQLYINDSPFSDSFSSTLDKEINEGILKKKIVLKDNEYVVLGDNREQSEDSRVFGQIKKENIKGKILFVK